MKHCDFCDQPAIYRCAQSGRYLCVSHARIDVVAPEDGDKARPLPVRPAEPGDREALYALAMHFWGETEVDALGQRYDLLSLPAFVACVGDNVVGALSYAVEDDRLHIVALHILPDYQGSGTGHALVQEAIAQAKREGLARVVLVTTNDNLPALYFYQRLGFLLVGLVPGALVHLHGREEPGMAGIPVRDEVQLELPLRTE
ncbi:MAG: GNAT family N-acetyltransferase [Chloroflexi bacterium]|nr:GNAT family N-acetyltransferase [Chloroflexota bacterium]